MPMDEPTAAYEEFLANLTYTRGLVTAGQGLALMKPAGFDVDDLYRAAWVQVVAVLDHWVTREIIERAVALALHPDLPRPPRFDKLEVPIALFDRVHHRNEELGEAFRRHWEEKFALRTRQNPEQIKEGLGYVSTVDLWPKVAKILGENAGSRDVTADQVREALRDIVARRNQIAHAADRNPSPPPARTPITSVEVTQAIDWLEAVAAAIVAALRPLPTGPDRDAIPGEADTTDRTLPAHQWDEHSLLAAMAQQYPQPVAEALLRVYRHAESHPSFRSYTFGKGAVASVTAWFRIGADEVPVWSISARAAQSVLSINQESLHGHGVSTERLAELLDRLRQLPDAERIFGDVDAADYGNRASLTSGLIVDNVDAVIGALDELLAVGTPALEGRLLSLALERGFQPSHKTNSYYELTPVNGKQVVYIDRSRTPRNMIVVFLHPDSVLDSLRSIPGLSVPADGVWVHSSNMRAFPKHLRTGKTPITYGYPIRCETEEAYGRLLEQI